MSIIDREQAELVIEGAETVDPTVPADVLPRALDHLQRLVHLLAAAGEERTIQERFSPQRNSGNDTAPIQVTGRFSLDAEGRPAKLTNVARGEPVDLSPMTFDRIEWAGRRIQIDPPLTLVPALDADRSPGTVARAKRSARELQLRVEIFRLRRG